MSCASLFNQVSGSSSWYLRQGAKFGGSRHGAEYAMCWYCRIALLSSEPLSSWATWLFCLLFEEADYWRILVGIRTKEVRIRFWFSLMLSSVWSAKFITVRFGVHDTLSYLWCNWLLICASSEFTTLKDVESSQAVYRYLIFTFHRNW